MKTSLQPMPVLLPSPVLIIGTYGEGGRPNAMNAAWGGIASSAPPCISVSLRAATLTHHNVTRSGAFTVNIPSEKYLREADFMGMASGRECDKFAAARLTPGRSALVNAPIVEEFPYSLECVLKKTVDLGSHTMFIGEIVGMVAHEEVLGMHGLPDIEKVRPLLWGSFGSMAYYGVGERLGPAFSVGKGLAQG